MNSVHIIGAGPAGAVAAISALREGHRVEMSEEHPTPGFPVDCSGLVSREGLESLSGLVDYRNHTINPIHGAILDFSGHTLRIDARKPVAFVINRASFDLSLSKKAESEGARLICNERISSQFRGDSIIGADGPNSSVASHFQFPQIRRFVLTARCTVKYDGENPHSIRAYLSNKLSPGFFSWLIPHNEEYAEMGTGVLLPKNPLPSLHSLSRRTGIPLPKEIRFALIPLECRKKTSLRSAGKSVLLAGDAAGQVKSTTGGGVFFGTSCARLAGRHAFFPEVYEKEWRALHGKDLRLHKFAHRLYGLLPDPPMNLAGKALSFFKVERYLEERGQMDRPTEILRPSLLGHTFSSLMQK
ncbi:MAG: NAD(P)/FAD-dependent oxidoreductase [Candidatus Micrarchaeota archaeon]